MDFLEFLAEITSFWTSLSPSLKYSFNSTHLEIKLENGFNEWVEDLLKEGYPFEVVFKFSLEDKTLLLKRTLRSDSGLWLVSEKCEGFPRQAFGDVSERNFTDLSDAERFFSQIVLPLTLFSGCRSFTVCAFIASRYPLISSPRLWGGEYPEVIVRLKEGGPEREHVGKN